MDQILKTLVEFVNDDIVYCDIELSQECEQMSIFQSTHSKNMINIIMPRNDALLFSQLMIESSRIDLDDHDALVVRRGNDRFTAMITHREFRQKMIRIDHAQRRIAELCGSYCDYKLVIDANHCHRPDDGKSLRWKFIMKFNIRWDTIKRCILCHQ